MNVEYCAIESDSRTNLAAISTRVYKIKKKPKQRERPPNFARGHCGLLLGILKKSLHSPWRWRTLNYVWPPSVSLKRLTCTRHFHRLIPCGIKQTPCRTLIASPFIYRKRKRRRQKSSRENLFVFDISRVQNLGTYFHKNWLVVFCSVLCIFLCVKSWIMISRRVPRRYELQIRAGHTALINWANAQKRWAIIDFMSERKWV